MFYLSVEKNHFCVNKVLFLYLLKSELISVKPTQSLKIVYTWK